MAHLSNRIMLFMLGLLAMLALEANNPLPAAADYVNPCFSGYECHYVSNDTSGTGVGTESNPFNTFAEVEAEQATWENDEKHTVLFLRGDEWSSSTLGILDLDHYYDGSNGAAYTRMDAYGEETDPRPRFYRTSPNNECIDVSKGNYLIKNIWVDGCRYGLDLAGTSATEGITDTRPVIINASLFEHNVAGVRIAGTYVGGMTNPAVTIDGNTFTDNDVMNVNNEEPCTSVPTCDSGAFGILMNAQGPALIIQNDITGSFADSFDYGTDGAAIEIASEGTATPKAYIWNNRGVDNDAFLEAQDTDGSALLYVENNQSRGSLETQKGFTIGANITSGTTFQRNSVYHTGSNSQGFTCVSDCNDLSIVKNNIFRATQATYTNDCVMNSVFDHNIYYGTTNAENGCNLFFSGHHSLTSNPLFNSETDLHIQSTSPAKDAGNTLSTRLNDCAGCGYGPYDMDTNYRPSYTPQDIGADERTS